MIYASVQAISLKEKKKNVVAKFLLNYLLSMILKKYRPTTEIVLPANSQRKSSAAIVLSQEALQMM